jgi:hypothetical protein
MGKRRASATGGLLAAVVIVVVLIVAAASGGGGSGTSGHVSSGQSLAHIRARNLRLQALIAVLTERQTLRIAGYGAHHPPRSGSAPGFGAQKSEPKVAPAEASASENECDPNYEGACLDPNASDYDCEGGSGDGPDYVGEVVVVGEDHFGLDADGDGIGCEAE